MAILEVLSTLADSGIVALGDVGGDE